MNKNKIIALVVIVVLIVSNIYFMVKPESRDYDIQIGHRVDSDRFNVSEVINDEEDARTLILGLMGGTTTTLEGKESDAQILINNLDNGLLLRLVDVYYVDNGIIVKIGEDYRLISGDNAKDIKTVIEKY